MRIKILTIAMLTSILSFPTYSQDRDFSKTEITTTEVAKGIYMLEGEGGNIGVSVGSDGVLIIDDQFAPLTEKIRAAISELSSQPIEFVINTHAHGDHVGGNANFSKAGAYVVSHVNSREHIHKENKDNIDALPKLTFDKELNFHFNEEKIRVFYVNKAHTDGDIVVYFENANVFHMGDLFVRYGFPYVDRGKGGDTVGLINTLNEVLAISDKKSLFIPGHGKLAGKSDVEAFRDMLSTIHKRVEKGIQEGESLDAIINSKPTRGFEEKGVKITDFVTTLYESIQSRSENNE